MLKRKTSSTPLLLEDEIKELDKLLAVSVKTNKMDNQIQKLKIKLDE